MRVIRQNVFETNSSSCHSVSVYRYNKKNEQEEKKKMKLPINQKGVLNISFDYKKDFWWGPAYYNDAYTKLNYVACAIVQIEMHKRWIKREGILSINELSELKDMKYLFSVIQKHCPNLRSFHFRQRDVFWKGSIGFEFIEGIDHASVEMFKDLKGWMNWYIDCFNITLEEFIFNPKYRLNIEGDG